jgi:hypothetical protein
MSYNMMIGYDDIYDCFYNGAFSIASKNDIDDQNLLLATIIIVMANVWFKNIEGKLILKLRNQ